MAFRHLLQRDTYSGRVLGWAVVCKASLLRIEGIAFWKHFYTLEYTSFKNISQAIAYM